MSEKLVPAVYQLKDPKNVRSFQEQLTTHSSCLLSLGLTSGPTMVTKAAPDTWVEIVIWKNEASVAAAHQSKEVQAIWGRLAEICEFKSLRDIPGSDQPFTGFEVVSSAVAPRQVGFADTMIAARDPAKLVAYYENVLDLKAADHGSFFMLNDPQTKQSLCITKGPSVGSLGLGFEAEDIGSTMRLIKKLGGAVESTWEYEHMDGANTRDPEGNEVLIFRIKSQ